MKVSDILRVKGSTLYTMHPGRQLVQRREPDGRKRHWLFGGDVAWQSRGDAVVS